MAITLKERRAAAQKAAQTRLEKQAAGTKEVVDDPHGVDHAELRSTESDVMKSYGVDRDEDAPWARPAELDAPPPRPGYTQRWIRIRLGNQEDSRNSMRKFREGWLPRKLETVPEGFLPPTFLHSRLGDVIGVDDLILCEMPIKKARQRNAYYKRKVANMVEAIESDLRRVDSGGPRIGVESRTVVTKRRNRAVMDPTE